MTNVFLKKYDTSDIFNLTEACLPQEIETIHKYSLKFTPTFSNTQYFSHFQKTKESFDQQLRKLRLPTAEQNTTQAIFNHVIKKYSDNIKKKYKFARNCYKLKSNLSEQEWQNIQFICNHPSLTIVPSDKNMGPVWLSKSIICDNTTIILNNKDNFKIDNRLEEEIIQDCRNEIWQVLVDRSYYEYINPKQRKLIEQQVCECTSIPLMIPLIKVHKKPIQWRPVCRMKKTWLSYNLQKFFTECMKQLLIDSQKLVRKKLIEVRKSRI